MQEKIKLKTIVNLIIYYKMILQSVEGSSFFV